MGRLILRREHPLHAPFEEAAMPEKETLKRARKDKREGKAPSTQAGEFVREEMHHIREGKHGARSPEQAIAIGLSKARRSGVKLDAPAPGKASSGTRKRAKQDLRRGAKKSKPSAKRSRATRSVLKREGKSAASKKTLGSHARAAARRRPASARSAAAKRAARTRAKSK
jgi:hypothetical protein